MAPNSSHIPAVAEHISTYLATPDLLFVQEIQDNSGPTNDGTTSANLTLTALVKAIAAASNVIYDFIEVVPEDGKDGGQPGGNIRQAYLYVYPNEPQTYLTSPDLHSYRSSKISLVTGAPSGEALDAVEVLDKAGKPSLSYVTESPPTSDILIFTRDLTLAVLTPLMVLGMHLASPWLPNGKRLEDMSSSPSTYTLGMLAPATDCCCSRPDSFQLERWKLLNSGRRSQSRQLTHRPAFQPNRRAFGKRFCFHR